MGDRRTEDALRDIDALFRLGVVSGMSDGQLLDRFAAQAGPESERAFEALVRRHGPMVLGVCRRMLGDEHAAEDSFQATFMVLALKARTIRKRESSGPWLHGVALRIARRARALRRRSKVEPIPVDGLPAPEALEAASVDLRGVLDEELSRLPDKYRIPVVLCYLEGHTQEHAARTLGWTKGTVSGRLARRKDILRHRLGRRGLAPAVGALTAALAPDTASAALPASLVVPAVRAAAAAVLGGAEAGVGDRAGRGSGPPSDEGDADRRLREDGRAGAFPVAGRRRPGHSADTAGRTGPLEKLGPCTRGRTASAGGRGRLTFRLSRQRHGPMGRSPAFGNLDAPGHHASAPCDGARRARFHARRPRDRHRTRQRHRAFLGRRQRP